MLLLIVPSAARAQRMEPRFDAQQDTAQQIHHGWTALRIAKWSTLAGSTAAVVYGFSQNRLADREYAAIEKLCEGSPDQCARTSSDTYADAALEQRYQSVVTRDRHARRALLAGQLGVAASVVLFVLDLRDAAAPGDIPYEPHGLHLDVSRKGLELQWRTRTP